MSNTFGKTLWNTGTILFIVPVFLCSLQCTAQLKEDAQIDVEYKRCLANDTSCGNIGLCAFTAYDKWNKGMEKVYNKLIKTFNKEKDRQELEQSQAAWIVYRDQTFKSLDDVFDRPGSKWCRLRHDSKIDMVRTRAKQLKTCFDALKKR